MIGIIAILIGILLPALSAARRQAATAKCLSNMRQLGLAFQMYASAYKNTFPVARQDVPEINGVPQNLAPPAGYNLYWHDMLFPFVMKQQKELSLLTTPVEFDNYRKSILWCPTWLANHTELENMGSAYTNRFYTGYAINMWPSFRPDYPKPDAMPPTSQISGRSTAAPGVGRYYKKNEWTDSSNRMLVADSTLWIVSMTLTNAGGTLSPQRVDYRFQEAGFTGSGPGAMNIDRYRHGKLPSNDGTFFKDGPMSYNIRFVDGHAITSTSMKDAYKAVRMKYP